MGLYILPSDGIIAIPSPKTFSEKTESGTSVIGIILPEIGAVTDILLIACVFICISHLIFLYNKYTTQTKINQQFIQKNIEI